MNATISLPSRQRRRARLSTHLASATAAKQDFRQGEWKPNWVETKLGENMGQSMKFVSAMVVVLALAAGASSSQELAQTDDQKCRTNGLKPGTAEYDKCRA